MYRKSGTDEKKYHPTSIPLLRLRRFVLRGVNHWSIGPQQLILEVVVTSCADVKMDHSSLLSLRLILVEHGATHRQDKSVRVDHPRRVEERTPHYRSLGKQHWCVTKIEK
jgi:hypothetical protein